jgi:hypothetical protein
MLMLFQHLLDSVSVELLHSALGTFEAEVGFVNK